jgi:N-acetylglucosaminyldiphosphoundecaprenol N-acetyl-beta-D-mannosaminyltransferase
MANSNLSNQHNGWGAASYLPTQTALPSESCELAAVSSFLPVALPTGVGPAEAQQQFQPLSLSEVWGLTFTRATMAETVALADRIVTNRNPAYFITANLNYLMLTSDHPQLRAVNQDCCCILADGNPIVWRSRLTDQPLPCRVAGSDLIGELAKLSAEKGYRIFLLGGAPGVAEKAAARLQQLHPKMQLAGTYSPPFRPLSKQEHNALLNRVREARTDILLVAFGQPKGEVWIHENYSELGVPLSIQLGASFDFLAGTARRALRVWQILGCEWLYRGLSDPKRLLPRYAKNLLFLSKLLASEFGLVSKWLLKRIASCCRCRVPAILNFSHRAKP